MRALVLQGLRFLGVGGVAYVVDTGLFNLLLVAEVESVAAKTVSTAVAIVVSYVGNRWFTFRASSATTGRREAARQVLSFLAVNVVAGGIGVGCLWVSRSVLGFEGALADNLAANVVGVGLGMVVRFVLYRAVVFRAGRVSGDESTPSPSLSPSPSSSPAREPVA